MKHCQRKPSPGSYHPCLLEQSSEVSPQRCYSRLLEGSDERQNTILIFLFRKMTIIVSGVLFLVSFLMIGFSQLLETHITVLVFRAVSGVAVGLAVPGVSIYIGETVTTDMRGVCGAVPALLHAAGTKYKYSYIHMKKLLLSIHSGVLVSYIIGTYLPWHTVSFICTSPALLLILTMMMLPESPTHLLRSDLIIMFRY